MNAENENKEDSDSTSASTESISDETKSEEVAEEKPEAAAEATPAKEEEAAPSPVEPPQESDHKPAPPAVSETTQPDNAGRREDRRNWMQNVNQTCDYIGRISRDKTLHFRASDKITSRLLIGAFLLALGFATLPFFEMNAIAAFAYVLADVLLLGAIAVFVVSRFGIIRAMEPRHALVCWHLMVGTGLLALVIGFNVVATVVLIMMRERLQLLFPGG